MLDLGSGATSAMLKLMPVVADCLNATITLHVTQHSKRIVVRNNKAMSLVRWAGRRSKHIINTFLTLSWGTLGINTNVRVAAASLCILAASMRDSGIILVYKRAKQRV